MKVIVLLNHIFVVRVQKYENMYIQNSMCFTNYGIYFNIKLYIYINLTYFV